MPPKPQKPNAYSIYVEERCHQTRTPRPLGFKKFNAEWMALDESKKDVYKELAKVRKAATTAASSPQTPRQIDRLSDGFPRKRNPAELEEGEDSDSEEPHPSRLRDPPPSSTVVAPPLKKIFVGDDEGDHVVLEMEEENISADLALTAFQSTSEQESLENINRAYANLRDFSELTVFSFSCVPVVISAGYKKGAILPINIPLEIGFAFFSLQEGINDEFFHAYVDPGPLPRGAVCDADETRRERHGLPCSPTDRSDDACNQFFDCDKKLENNYLDLYNRVLDFVGFDGTNAQLLMPMCSRSADLQVNEACLKWLHWQAVKQLQDAGFKNLPEWSHFTTLPELHYANLEDFTRLAVINCVENEPIPRLGYTRSAINRAFAHFGFYKQLHNLNCWYHRKVTSVKVCALGAARECCLFNLPDDHRFVYMGGPHSDDSDVDD